MPFHWKLLQNFKRSGRGTAQGSKTEDVLYNLLHRDADSIDKGTYTDILATG
jgi:hypothetical protein